MLRAIEDRGEEGIFVNVFKQSIAVRDLRGGELSADEVAMVNAVYPNSIADDYAARSFAAPDEPNTPEIRENTHVE